MTNILENKNLTNIDIEENISNENNEEVGLIQRILQYLFKRSKEKEENENQFEFSISYMEIYLENIKDLLERNNFKNVEIREDENGKINLINLNKIKIDSPEQALQYLNYGNSLRQTAPTLKNQKSSRSHAIFTIYIENKIKSSVFHIIDLAGSESQKGAGTFGERVKEGGANNKSLLALSRVIKELLESNKDKKDKEDKRNIRIPYRDSKLTLILKDSLGGTAKTLIIATISQLASNFQETKNTLEFVQKAKEIKNNTKINEKHSFIKQFKELEKKYNDIKYEKEKLENQLEEISNILKHIPIKDNEKYEEEKDALQNKTDNDISFQLVKAKIKYIINDFKKEKNKIIEIYQELKNQIKDPNPDWEIFFKEHFHFNNLLVNLFCEKEIVNSFTINGMNQMKNESNNEIKGLESLNKEDIEMKSEQEEIIEDVNENIQKKDKKVIKVRNTINALEYKNVVFKQRLKIIEKMNTEILYTKNQNQALSKEISELKKKFSNLFFNINKILDDSNLNSYDENVPLFEEKFYYLKGIINRLIKNLKINNENNINQVHKFSGEFIYKSEAFNNFGYI